MKRSAPRKLDTTLGELVSDFTPGTLLAEIQSVWVTVVGEAIASECSPVSEAGGILKVHCSRSVWTQELEMMSVQIREKINQQLVIGEITQIRFSTSGNHPA